MKKELKKACSCEQVGEKDKRILSLERQIGGFRTSNENYRLEIQNLRKEKLNLEGKYNILHDDYKEIESELNTCKVDLRVANGNLQRYKKVYEDFVTAPWYKRLFFKNDFIID